MLLSAAFLAGLAAVAIPVVIHLIHRQRYPERAFTTLRFFDKTVKHNVIQRRLIDRVLLALRVLALALLALGLSRPFWSGGGVGERRMSLVIVIDNSPSMGRMREGKTLLDHAKVEAAKVLDQMGPADRVEILLTAGGAGAAAATTDRAALSRELARHAGEPMALMAGGEDGAAASLPGLTTDAAKLDAALAKVPAGAAVSLSAFDDRPAREFGYDVARLRALLDSVKVSALPGDAHGALVAAGELLATSRDGDRKALVLSDVQAGKWNGQPVPTLANTAVSVVTIEPSGPLGPNLAIDGCELSQSEAGLGQRVTATFTLHNYGTEASPASTLTVVAGERDRPAENKVASIPPGASMLVSAPLRATGRDHMLCTATIKSSTDPFAYDNTWHFQLAVRPPVTTLCVNGTSGATGSDKSTFFVMNALATRSAGGAAPVDARECEVDDLKDQKLFQYAVVVLADVRALDAESRTKLRQFVADGGGLLMFNSPGGTIDEYNAWNLLPGRATAQRTKDFLYVKSVDARALAMADVRDRAGTAIHAFSTDASLAIDPAPAATVLARFSDGSPALVEGQVGKGRVIVAAASGHVSQSDWPLRPAFVLMVRQLVQYLGGAAEATSVAPQRTVGEGAAMAIPAERAGGTPAAFRVGGDAANVTYEPLPWYRAGDRLALPTAAAPGQYLLSVRPEAASGALAEPGLGANVAPVSVNHALSESDLTPARAETIQKQLPGANVNVVALGADLAATLRGGRELWRWLLIATLAFLLVESVIAWRAASESSQ